MRIQDAIAIDSLSLFLSKFPSQIQFPFQSLLLSAGILSSSDVLISAQILVFSIPTFKSDRVKYSIRVFTA